MSWHTQGPPLRDDEDERELKCQFARFVVENPTLADEAGYHVFPGTENYGRAMQANTAWPHCPIVRAEKRRLVGDDVVTSLLPDEDAFAKKVLDRADKALDDKDAFAGMRLYAEIKGIIKKGPAVAVDNRTINVIQVPPPDATPEDDEDFNRRFKAQQTRLIENARSDRAHAA